MSEKLDERKIIEALNKGSTIDGDSDIVTAGAVSAIEAAGGSVEDKE